MQGLSERVIQSLAGEAHPCLSCGRPALFTVQTTGTGMATTLVAPHYWVHMACRYCGVDLGPDTCLPSVDQLVYWSDPRARQFLLRHPRCMSSLGAEVERDGADALTFRLSDLDGADQLTVVARRETLRVLLVD